MKKAIISKSVIMTGVALAALLGILTSGCTCTTMARANRVLPNSSQDAANALAHNLEQPVVSGQGGILVASFVNIDEMTVSSSFGRMASEQIASALARAPHLFPIAEVKLRRNVFLKEKAGEFLISREVVEVSSQHSAQAVLVGTYAIGNQAVYVSSRMVNPQTNQIVSAYNYDVPLDDNLRTLLGYKRIHRPGWWARLWGDRDVWSNADRDYYKYYPDYL